MPLDISTIQAGMIIRAAHLTQYYNVLTGIVQDQPITLAHQLTVGGGSVIGPGIVPLTIHSQTAQTANVLEVRDPTSSLVFAVSSSGSITLAGTLQAGNVTATGNLTVDGYVVPPLNVGTPNERITNPSLVPNHLALESTDGLVFVEGLLGADLSGNLYYDGSNWNLFNTAQTGTILSVSPTGTTLYTATAGTNPRTLATVMSVSPAGVIGGALSFSGAVTFNGAVTFAAGTSALTVGGNMTVSGTYLLMSRGADPSPYTQQRLAVYNDGANWAYFAYGQDAQMRIVYSSGGAALLFGTSTATNNTGTYTNRMTLDGSGNLTAVGQVAGAALSISGNGTISGTLTAAGANISNVSVSGTITTGAINSADWFRLSQPNVGIYNSVTGTGIQLTSGQLLYPSGDQIAGVVTTQTLQNKTIINLHESGPVAFVANGNDLTNYVFNYYSSTVTLPNPSAAYVGTFRAIKAWGAAITVNCGVAVLAGPGAVGMAASFTLNNGDSVTMWCDGSYWWTL